MRFLVIGVMFLSQAAIAQCIRFPISHATPPELDGPGSFGPLNETLTLDCLSLIITYPSSGTAVVSDENRVIYNVKVGDRIGENGGRIQAIGKDFIEVQQIVAKGKAVGPALLYLRLK